MRGLGSKDISMSVVGRKVRKSMLVFGVVVKRRERLVEYQLGIKYPSKHKTVIKPIFLEKVPLSTYA
jgi:hypothetical protein